MTIVESCSCASSGIHLLSILGALGQNSGGGKGGGGGGEAGGGGQTMQEGAQYFNPLARILF